MQSYPNSDPRSLVYDASAGCVRIIDQTRLPRQLVFAELRQLRDFCVAIADMQVRGAPLIGVTAAYGLALALRESPGRQTLSMAAAELSATRPTAVNLSWALERVTRALEDSSPPQWPALALAEAGAIADAEIDACRRIGEAGLPLLESLRGGGPVNILTHCNAGRLATLEWGTATAPIYLAARRGMPVHVWVSETRPRNQGAGLTAWELQEAGIPYTVITDNAAGALMQAGRVDCVLVGSDRTAANGDVCNKIGTYMKAVLARAHGIPFYAALPLSTIDWQCADGSGIPIEERSQSEVLTVSLTDGQGEIVSQPLSVAGARAWNPAFDVTPAALVTAIITEAGVAPATRDGLGGLRDRLS
jgi:methylthioribose-1-phosphate isomerase